MLAFQEYIRDLEKEEEEQRKLQMVPFMGIILFFFSLIDFLTFLIFNLIQEEQRKVERKNRDEFRKLMEEHVASGILTAKTLWRDYCSKVCICISLEQLGIHFIVFFFTYFQIFEKDATCLT